MERHKEGQLVGDRPSILDLLDLEFIEENLYRSSVIVEGPRARLFGGQVAAQALMAAGRTVEHGRVLDLRAVLIEIGDARTGPHTA